MKKRNLVGIGDTDTKKNSAAPKAGVGLRNLDNSKDKSSAESRRSAPHQAATGDVQEKVEKGWVSRKLEIERKI